MDVTFRARFERYTFDKTMVPSREFDRRPDLVWRIGKLHAEGTTCLHSGTWRILAPMHITGSSEGLDGAGKGIGMGRAKTIRWWGAMQPDWGWGIGRKDSKGPLVAKKPYVEVVQMECVRGMLWSTLEDVLSLVPMPNWTFDLGKTVATKFLPKDRMQCRDYGTDRVSFWARNDGTIATGIASQRWNPLYEETERPPPDHAAIGFGARGLIDVQRLGTEANVE